MNDNNNGNFQGNNPQMNQPQMNQQYNQYPQQMNGGYPQQPVVNQKPKKPIHKKWWFWLIIIIVVLGIIGAVSGGDDSSDDSNNNETTASSQVDAKKDEAVEGQIGDYVCTVKKAEICKNWEGKDSVKITYEFTNNASDAQSFDIALTDNVYQDGVGLESTFISSDDDDWGIDVKIKPGVTKEVSKVYVLRDTTTDLEVEIGELISFDDTKVTTTVKLEQ